MRLCLEGGSVLLPDGTLENTEVVVDGAVIESVGEAAGGSSVVRWRLDGMLVLPGIVDLHGDAFERQIMPRPRVSFPLELALLETDRQLVTNAITTAFHAITWSWEPGLRGGQTAVSISQALAALAPRLACDHRIHIRHETFNLAAEAEMSAWLAAGRIDLLAFNDHVEHIGRELEDPVKRAQYAARSGLSEAAYRRLLDEVRERAGDVPASVAHLAAAATRAGVPLASHDDDSPDVRAWYRSLGCRICEFPETAETARAAGESGDAIVLGAPNVVRGGSHHRGTSAAELIGAGLGDALASDYYYPAPLHAALRLERDGLLDFGAAWDAVAAGPARAAGLDDRGEIAAGKRADLVVLRRNERAFPEVVATIVGGRPVHQSEPLSGGRSPA